MGTDVSEAIRSPPSERHPIPLPSVRHVVLLHSSTYSILVRNIRTVRTIKLYDVEGYVRETNTLHTRVNIIKTVTENPNEFGSNRSGGPACASVYTSRAARLHVFYRSFGKAKRK